MPYGVGAFFFEECESTNALAAEMAQAGETGPQWIVAGRQTSGRGRRGREWVSQSGNLYASLLFRPNIRPTDMAALPFLVALAVRQTFVDLGVNGTEIKCKWPNDVLISGKKTSGILIESSARNAEALDHVIIGIGLNLVHFPDDALFSATSLVQETGRTVTAKEALGVLAQQMFDHLNKWDTSSTAPIVREWTAHAWGLGTSREIRTHDDTFIAALERLADDGGLIVRLDDGSEKRLYAGDVFPVSRSK